MPCSMVVWLYKERRGIMKREDEAIYGLLAPWLFIIGMCTILSVLVIIDSVFNLGLSN